MYHFLFNSFARLLSVLPPLLCQCHGPRRDHPITWGIQPRRIPGGCMLHYLADVQARMWPHGTKPPNPRLITLVQVDRHIVDKTFSFQRRVIYEVNDEDLRLTNVSLIHHPEVDITHPAHCTWAATWTPTTSGQQASTALGPSLPGHPLPKPTIAPSGG